MKLYFHRYICIALNHQIMKGILNIYIPNKGTTPEAMMYGTHRESNRTEITGAASLRIMKCKSMLRIPFAYT